MAAERPGSSSPAAETDHRRPVAPGQSNCGRSSYAGPVKYVMIGTLPLFCEQAPSVVGVACFVSCQPVTSVPLASQPCVKLILTRSDKSKRKYRKNDAPVAGVTSQLRIKYVGRRVGKALGDAVGLQMIFGGKGRNKLLCIIDATSYCRCTSLYRLLKWILYRMTNAVDGGGRT